MTQIGDSGEAINTVSNPSWGHNNGRRRLISLRGFNAAGDFRCNICLIVA